MRNYDRCSYSVAIYQAFWRTRILAILARQYAWICSLTDSNSALLQNLDKCSLVTVIGEWTCISYRCSSKYLAKKICISPFFFWLLLLSRPILIFFWVSRVSFPFSSTMHSFTAFGLASLHTAFWSWAWLLVDLRVTSFIFREIFSSQVTSIAVRVISACLAESWILFKSSLIAFILLLRNP